MGGETLVVSEATWDTDVMKTPELVMVDFWAVWCGPCQMVAPIVDELAREYDGKLKVRKLNTDESGNRRALSGHEHSDHPLFQKWAGRRTSGWSPSQASI